MLNRKRLAAERVFTYAEGGTGISNYRKGDVIIASGNNVLVPLAVGTEGYVLKVVSGIPAWALASSFSGGITIGDWTITEEGTSPSNKLYIKKGGVVKHVYS